VKPIGLNWKLNVPTTAEIEGMWRGLKYEIIDGDFEFIKALQASLGGYHYFKGFRFAENDVFDWYCSRGRLDEINFFNKFLLSEKILRTFVDRNASITAIEREFRPEEKPGFILDGELANLLYNGGAYPSKYQGSTKEMKQLAQDFCLEIFDEHYEHESVRYYTSDTAWNSWFIDFIIDYTYLIICMKTRTMWMIAYTDTD
jgi:hypothetical protein